MKFVLKPSLEQMTLVKIVTSLWNLNDVRTLISKLEYDDFHGTAKWQMIEDTVRVKVSQLSLPQPLKENVLGLIEPIGLQIRRWLLYHCKYEIRVEFETDQELALHARFCWTPQGTVDRKRTAEMLVKDEKLEVPIRYCLACDYLLEDDINQLWNRLLFFVKDEDWSYFPVIRFWSDIMKRRGAGHIPYEHLFYESVADSNKVAAKYFLQKLTSHERKKSLKVLARYLSDADVLCSLLCEMREEEQIEVLKCTPKRVMRLFFQWPFQSFFIEVANCMWGFLSKDSYTDILGAIIDKVRRGYDYNYQMLFREFWQKSPNVLKDSFIDEIGRSCLLGSLFDIKNKENLKYILKDATLTAKVKFIYSDKISYYLTNLIHESDWDFLKFLIRECLPSKHEMLKFKEEFGKRMRSKEYSAMEKYKWNQLFLFSKDSFCKYSKRSLEEGECSSSK